LIVKGFSEKKHKSCFLLTENELNPLIGPVIPLDRTFSGLLLGRNGQSTGEEQSHCNPEDQKQQDALSGGHKSLLPFSIVGFAAMQIPGGKPLALLCTRRRLVGSNQKELCCPIKSAIQITR
jgi:hypothetical protein